MDWLPQRNAGAAGPARVACRRPSLEQPRCQLSACGCQLDAEADVGGLPRARVRPPSFRQLLVQILAPVVAFVAADAVDGEAIVTNDVAAARKFTTRVDAAAVFVNASTAFTDGAEFGMGAEIGISTQKLHARGPMGLSELTSSKWVVWGEGHTRAKA